MTDDSIDIHDIVDTSAQKLKDLSVPLGEAADTAVDFVKENAGLTVLGGIAIGVAVGAMLTVGRRKPKKAARALASLTTTVSDLSQKLAAQASDRAEAAAKTAHDQFGDTADTIGKALHDNSEHLLKKGKKLADDTTEQLNDGGKALARAVVNLVEKIRP